MINLEKEWINRLGLQNWTIKVIDNCEPADIGKVFGCVDYEESVRSAVIRMVDCAKLPNDLIKKFDYEKTLVHELLHLKLCLLCDSENDLQDRLVHQIIDDLARSFISAKRFYCDKKL